METNELNLKKRIARNKIAKEIMLIGAQQQVNIKSICASEAKFIGKILARNAVIFANAFVDEIENNMI